MIGVTFVQKTEARDEETVRPRMRGRGTELAIEMVTISGPYKGQAAPTRRAVGGFSCVIQRATSDETACAKQILSTLERRAYRRPVDRSRFRGRDAVLYRGPERSGSFDRGIEQAVERLLVSPQFLFRIERDPPNVAPGTRRSASAIWSLHRACRSFSGAAFPTTSCSDVAARGKLKDPAVLEHQVRRMLADPRSESLVTNFAEQWLYLRDIDAKKPDELLFPDFDETLREAFRQETDLFLDSVLRRKPQRAGSDDGELHVRQRAAGETLRHPQRGGELLPPRHVSTRQPARRAAGAGQYPDDDVLCHPHVAGAARQMDPGEHPLQPSASASAQRSGAQDRSQRHRQAAHHAAGDEAHRANPVCASCHARMDPIGFAMENFDAVGQWRDRRRRASRSTPRASFPTGRNSMAWLS